MEHKRVLMDFGAEKKGEDVVGGGWIKTDPENFLIFTGSIFFP